MVLVKKSLCLKMFLIVLAVLYCVECAERTTHTQLLTDLLMNYGSPYSRPVRNDSHAVSVGFRFAPIMTDLDETTQELQIRGMFFLTWKDDRLMWNETDYEGILEITVPLFQDGVGRATIWKPELVLYESLSINFGSFHPDTKAVTVNHTGDVYWYTLATTKSSCTVLVRYYPFDKQICELTFTTWLYQTNEQIFYAVSDIVENGAYKSYAILNAQWEVAVDIVKVGNASYACITCAGQEQSFVYYKLILIRGLHGLYFFNIILPCFVMSAMTLIVVWLPPKDVAGAASLGVTCVLAFFVFLTFLFTQLPATGIPLIGNYIVWLIGEATVVTVYAVHRATREQKKLDRRSESDSRINSKTSSTNVDDPGRREEEMQFEGNQNTDGQTKISGCSRGDSDTDHGEQSGTQIHHKSEERVSKFQVCNENENSSGCNQSNENVAKCHSNNPLVPNETDRQSIGSIQNESQQADQPPEDVEGSDNQSLVDKTENEENYKGSQNTSRKNEPEGDATMGRVPNETEDEDHDGHQRNFCCSFKRKSTHSKPSDPSQNKNKETIAESNQRDNNENREERGCSSCQVKSGVTDFLANVRQNFENSKNLTKAMIFIKVSTTLVCIIILLFYIGS